MYCEVCRPPASPEQVRRTTEAARERERARRSIRTARDVLRRIDELERTVEERRRQQRELQRRRFAAIGRRRRIARHGRDVVRHISRLERRGAAAERREERRRREYEAAERERWARDGLCGCGRDYLTVALEDAHVCPRPIAPTPGAVPPAVEEVWIEAVELGLDPATVARREGVHVNVVLRVLARAGR